ncbi:MAG: hypothetical protein JKX99_09785 [Robiginitomaculum sp.]|nr:hypothetical protein [Robiginitomaculum sp.]
MVNSIVGVRLDGATQKRLKQLGACRDRSPHYLMKEAVEIYLKREEEVEAEKVLVQARWEKFELTGETIPNTELKVWAAKLAKPQTP